MFSSLYCFVCERVLALACPSALVNERVLALVGETSTNLPSALSSNALPGGCLEYGPLLCPLSLLSLLCRISCSGNVDNADNSS